MAPPRRRFGSGRQNGTKKRTRAADVAAGLDGDGEKRKRGGSPMIAIALPCNPLCENDSGGEREHRPGDAGRGRGQEKMARRGERKGKGDRPLWWCLYQVVGSIRTLTQMHCGWAFVTTHT